MKRLICILLILVVSFPLIPRLASAAEPEASATRTAWENPYTLTTFGEGNRVNSTFFTFPKVIWNGSQYVDYVLNTSDMSAGIGSVYIKVCPDHTIFYDPDQKQERVASERWAVEYLNSSSLMWESDSAVDNKVCSAVNSSGIYFGRKSTLQSGAVLNVWYWLRIGSELKITVTLNPVLNGDYRLVWALNGVSGVKARYLATTQNVTQQVTEDRACSSVQFLGDNESRCLVDWSDAVFFNSTSGKLETCFRQLKLQEDASDGRCQARILFTNFQLTRGESMVLDPTVQTFNSSIASEGYILRYGYSYPGDEYTCVYTNGTEHFNALKVGQWLTAGLYVQSRSYLSFDTHTIPSLAYNISATLNLTTFCLDSTDNVNFSVWLLGSNQSNPQPIYNNNLTVDSWGRGSGPIATWNVSNYPGAGHNVSFAVPPDQINKINSTEFELMSSEEGIAPIGYEYFGFYPGNSTGNEPRLEVSYCLDTRTIEGVTWFYRNVSSDKIVIVFFGANIWVYYDYLRVRSIDVIDENPPEKALSKIQFLDGLINNGFSVLTPKNDTHYPDRVEYGQSSVWIYDAVMWLMYNQSYRHIFLFGFSGGGVIVSNEIQKDYATRLSVAVMTCAPVCFPYYYPLIYHSALTAANTKVATCFPEPVNDDYYSHMSLYYNNTPSAYYNGELASKEWHDWTGGHDFFSQTDYVTGENATTVVVDWYGEVHPPNAPFAPTETGSTGLNCTYSSGTYVSNDDNVSYVFYWGDGTNTTTGQYPSGQNVTASHMWAVPGVYNVTVRAYDNTTGLWSDSSPPLNVNMVPNVPFAPTETVSASLNYTYSSGGSVTWHGDSVSYVFDWGDGTNTTTGQYPSGENVSVSRTWAVRGVYNVTVKAYDNVTGLWTAPSPPLTVNMSVVLNIITAYLPWGTTSPALGTYAVRYGTNVTVTALPNAPMVFYGWSLDSEPNYAYNITLNMTADHTLQAVFALNGRPAPRPPYMPTETGLSGVNYTYSSGTIEPNNYNLTSYVFYWGDGTNTTINGQYPSGQNVSASHAWTARGVYNVTVRAYCGMTGNWSDPSPPLTVNMSVVLTISKSGGGGSTTSPVPGTYAIRYGANATVTATPHGKWVFADWLLDSSTYYYNNPITVNMTADHSLLAEFDYNPGPLRVETGG